MILFDGPARRIQLPLLDQVSVREIYSRWVDWFLTGDNSKYLPAFSTVGGDPLGQGRWLGDAYFLENGWRIQPDNRNYTLLVDGNLYVREGGDPFAGTQGGYDVHVRSTVSNLVQTVSTGSGGGGTSAGDVWGYGMDAGMSAAEILRLVASVLLGNGIRSGSRIRFRDLAGAKDRVVANLTHEGGRTVTYRDGT